MKSFTKVVFIFITLFFMMLEANAQFVTGDVFVAVGNGSVQWRKPNGTLVQTLNTGQGGFTTGMGFDTAKSLYVTCFSASTVFRFDKFGNPIGVFGTGNSTPECILFDANANAYVGNLGNGIRKYDAAGNFLSTSFAGRLDWMDLQADQCTMLRDSEGSTIETHDICTNLPGATFATGLSQAFALRIIPAGGPFAGHVLVADLGNIKRFNAAGVLQTTYDVTGEDAWFGLNLDPDGTSFWSADFGTANVYRMDIATGNVITTWNTGTGGNTVFGITIAGEITAATELFIDLTPRDTTNLINTQHCVTATVTNQVGAPEDSVFVIFQVRGANGILNGNGTTNAAGQVQFCYVGTNIGRDTIFATIGTTGRTDTAFKTWEGTVPVELSSFTSTVDRKDVTLNWTTVTEVNNSGFDIERSSVAGQWSKVGFVQGNGSTTETKNYTFVERNLNSGRYSYRLKQIDFNGNFEYYNLSNEVVIGIPTQFSLSQNYPNPFNPTTKIDFELPRDGNVKLYVYDISGKTIATMINGFKPAGYYTVEFNASNLASGIYFYKLETNEYSKVMKMSVLK